MNFKEAIKILGIEDYEERIFNSNSHGELFHIHEYAQFVIYNQEGGITDFSWFRPLFLKIVNKAKVEWKRPESVFQHIFTIIAESFPDGKIYRIDDEE